MTTVTDLAPLWDPGTVTAALDVGRDLGTPVNEAYTVPFAFTGTIDKVQVDLK